MWYVKDFQPEVSHGANSRVIILPGSLTFDVEYSRWLYEHQRQIGDLRVAVNSHASDGDLSVLVDAVMAHYDEVFKLKSVGAKSNIFHMLSGMWTTPAERCFMWLGGFRSSELLKVRWNRASPLCIRLSWGLHLSRYWRPRWNRWRISS